MKVSKSQGVLYILDALKEEGSIKKSKIIADLEINELTFWRYIQEVRAFIYNFNKPYELIYDRKEELYYLKNYK